MAGLCVTLGCFSTPGSFLSWAQTPGTLDKTFGGQGADGFIRVVAVQADGKILAGGNFSTVRGVKTPLIARLSADGKADTGFVSPFPTPVGPARIYTVAVQPDGDIVAAGIFTNVGGFLRTNIARLHADGSLDQNFSAGTGPSGLVRILALQTDGKILLGGEFTSVNQTNRNRIGRLNPNGSLDDSFDPGSGANNIVRTVVALANGQVLVGGLFTSFNGRPASYLVRLNANGSLDSSFPAGSGPNGDVYFIAPQTNGTLLVGGDFTAVNGSSFNRIVRLQSDGSLDPSFSTGSGVVGGPVYHIIRQLNGKLVIGGGFTNVDGAAMNRLARLNPDGSVDPGFTPGTAASDLVLSLALQSDGRLVAGGLFATYDGSTVGMLACIFGDPAFPQIAATQPGAQSLQLSWPSWAVGYNVQSATHLYRADWQPFTNLPVLQGDQWTITVPSTGGTQFFRLVLP